MKIKGVLIDVFKEEVREIEVEKNLDSYYKILGCDCIDIVNRQIGDKSFDIICDDEGVFKEPQKISAINNLGEPMLVGNLFVVKFDGVDDETSLSDDEIKYVIDHCQKIFTRNFPDGYKALTQVEY